MFALAGPRPGAGPRGLLSRHQQTRGRWGEPAGRGMSAARGRADKQVKPPCVAAGVGWVIRAGGQELWVGWWGILRTLRASSRKPESQEGPRGQESGQPGAPVPWEGDGQSLAPASSSWASPGCGVSAASEAVGTGSSAPGGVGGMEEPQRVGQSPLLQKGNLRPQSRRAGPKPHCRGPAMDWHTLCSQAGTHPPQCPRLRVLFQPTAPSPAPKTPRPPWWEPSS